MDYVFRILLIIFLLYPVILGFYFGGKKPKTSKRFLYGSLAVLLTLTNMILVIATYFGSFTSDSWFNFIFFFLFEIVLLATTILHLVMTLNDKYVHQYIQRLSIVILVSGLLYSISLMIFSNPNSTVNEGLSIADAMLSTLPTLLASSFFALTGTDKSTFNPFIVVKKEKKKKIK